MNKPSFYSTGEPTEETLKLIREWDFRDEEGLENFLTEAMKEYGRVWRDGDRLHIATGGWSGNEEIISALQENPMFWATRWESSHRGGKFVFRPAKPPPNPQPELLPDDSPGRSQPH